jgi:hypothetical protein
MVQVFANLQFVIKANKYTCFIKKDIVRLSGIVFGRFPALLEGRNLGRVDSTVFDASYRGKIVSVGVRGILTKVLFCWL